MQTDNEYLQCLGLGLQGLRASGQFCDAMVCVGSTRILVHKVVLSAASKTLHDLALEFDMTPHRERDQLEIVIPPDISLYAVNMFINYLYTGQVELREAMVGHMERLACQFSVAQLLRHCQEFSQRMSAPDSQNLNLQEERQPIEPDSSSTMPALLSRPVDEDSNLEPNLTRSSSSCSGFSSDAASGGYHSVPVKIEPTQHKPQPRPQPQPGTSSVRRPRPLKKALPSISTPAVVQKSEQNFDELEKLMSPVVSIQKLPLNITPDVVVIVSDDETEGEENGTTPFRIKPAHKYSLKEKEAVAIEAKRYGTTHVSQTRNIPLPDVLSWMALFGLRGPGIQKTIKPGKGKQVNHEADISIVRWIVQQQELNGCVDLNHMKQYALTVYRQTMPKFTASFTWLGNFLQRNMSVLQGTKFVHDEEVSQSASDSSVSVKKELMSVEDLAEMNRTRGSKPDSLIGELGENSVLEGVSMTEQRMVNAALGVGHDDSDDDGAWLTGGGEDYKETPDTAAEHAQNYQVPGAQVDHIRAIGAVQTPFGKRPIIVGQSKSFDAKSERKIVQWVLERNARDGYVFTDDFRDYARSLYTGSKTFGGTQAWMKKFIRRNRAIKDIKFCSKYKNTYSNEEKISAVAMARRFGTGYAAKHMGINHKLIHCWKLAMDRGQLSASQSVLNRLLTSPINAPPLPESPDLPGASATQGGGILRQALHGIVPEFEEHIIQEMKAYQAREGSISYDEISKISQAIYKETRPTFKASYAWIRSFLDRHKEATKDIDIENVSKVLVESEAPAAISSEKISQMVDTALKELGDDVDLTPTDTSLPGEPGLAKPADRRPIIVGPSVSFDRKTEKLLVDWAIDKQSQDGYVFTDDFKAYAKSLHTGTKRFSASSGWMSLFLRRHRNLRHVNWRSKFKNNYSEEEKVRAVEEARRLGTGHVGRTLGIDPALICAWRIKMEKAAQKQTFWKGTKIRKFGKASKLHQPKFFPVKSSLLSQQGDASRGIVPEFEQRIVALILEEHQKEGSISYEEISSISQSIYKETRPTFKASYAWIRNFMKRHETELANINIDNVKKVFMPEDEEQGISVQGSSVGGGHEGGSCLQFQKRPIILGQSRMLDTKTEKKLVQWLVEQQEKNGYVFLDQFKAKAQSLYDGNKKFAATQAWRIKFLRRNHAAVKHIKFTSSFRNQYSLEEKKAIVIEANRLGSAHVAKQTGIDQCLITSWRNKLKRSGELPEDLPTPSSGQVGQNTWTAKLLAQSDGASQKLTPQEVGPGLYSHRGVVPKFEKKIVVMINHHMDNEGSVSYQDVSNIARAVYKETRPHFKASYNWIKAFLKRHKKGLRNVQFEQNSKLNLNSENGTEILIPEDTIEDMEMYLPGETSVDSWESYEVAEPDDGGNNPQIVIENAEAPEHEPPSYTGGSQATSKQQDYSNIVNMASKKPIIIGKAKHFDRKTEKKLVDWLLQTQQNQGFVFTDDFRAYARSLYTGPPGKFAATNAWFSKFLRRNKLAKNIKFESKLKGNNPAIEEHIVQLILEQQEKEGSVSNDDIQKITQAAYKEIRPNFRACYNWIRDFIKRHKEELAQVELENVKKVFIPDDDNETDGVLVRDYDPMKSLQLMDTSAEYQSNEDTGGYNEDGMGDSSWMDLDSSQNQSMSSSSFSEPQSTSSVIGNLANKKRPIIIAPPKVMDIKTEKKLVQWMVAQQEEHGCVYLDLFKEYAKSIHTGPKKFAATQAWMVKFKQRNHAALKNVVIKSRFRNEYSMAEKMAAVEEARRLGCNHVGRKLGINGGVIYSWKVQLEQAERLGGVQPGAFSDVSSSRGMVPEFEEKIVNLVLQTQSDKKSVSYDDIRNHAISVYAETRPNFKASNNWVMEFIRKNKDRFEHVNFENQRKFVTEEEKLHILSEEKKYGTEHVTKKRNISASTIYQWKRNMIAKSIPIPTYKTKVGNKIKQKYAKGKKLYKTHTEAEKRSIVKVAEENGVTYASLKLGVSKNMIAKWVRYFRDGGENIVINFKHASTVKKDLEQKVVAWVLEQNKELGIVMTNRVQEYAKQMFEDAYTNFNATDRWLETFISTNAETFENVRFREKGDTDLEFSEEIKLKLARHAEKHGAIETSSKTGVAPKNIYNWRRILRLKGYDLSSDSPSLTIEAERNVSEESKSLMQKKLEKIEQKYSLDARKALVVEANSAGASATGTAHKIPLPLLLQWMKKYPNGQDQDMKPDFSLPGPRSSYINKCASSKESTPDSGSSRSLKVRWPSVEKAKATSTPSSVARYTEEFKREICAEAKQFSVMDVATKRGVSKNSIYAWMKNFTEEEDRRSVEKSRSSLDNSRSSFDSDVDVSTPIRVHDIKKEPEVFPSMSEETYSEGISSIKRTYTPEEKQQVAKRAIEIGVKETSLEMDIPISNVRRWADAYKKSLQQTASYEKKKEKKQLFKLSSLLKRPSSILGNASEESGNESATSFSKSSDGGLTSGTGVKRKSDTPDAGPAMGVKQRKVYTDDEKLDFVLQSDAIGTRVAADNAGVSIDVLYKWRQKFNNRPKVSKTSSPASSRARANKGASATDTASPLSAIIEALQTSCPEDEHNSVSESTSFVIENIGVESDENMEAQVEKDVSLSGFQDDDPAGTGFHHDVLITESNFDSINDISTSSEEAIKDQEENLMQTNFEGMSEMQPILLMEKSAASKVLEMTTDYIEAEKEHEKSQFGTDSNSFGDLSEVCDHKKAEEGTNLGMIKILDVKSHAPD